MPGPFAAFAALHCLVCQAPAAGGLRLFCSPLCRSVWTMVQHSYALEAATPAMADAEPLLACLTHGEPLPKAERYRLIEWLIRTEMWRQRVMGEA